MMGVPPGFNPFSMFGSLPGSSPGGYPGGSASGTVPGGVGYTPQSGIYAPQGGLPAMLLSGGNTPQQQGYGIANPNWPMAYDTGQGLMPGTPQDMQNADMGAAGAAETQFANNAARYDQPGQMTQWWQQNQGQFQRPGMGEQFARNSLNQYANGTPQYTQQALDRSINGMPELSANLDPYYKNAKRRASEDIAQEMAARGMASGSPGMDRAAEAMTDLSADQANREAQYGLDYSADRRNWNALQGQLAGQADQSEQGWMRNLGDLAMSGQRAGLDRLGQAGQLAGAADSADLARLRAGQDAAGAAQQAQLGRLGQLYNQELGLGSAMGGMANDAYNSMLTGDQNLMDSQIAWENGLGAEALNRSDAEAQRFKDDFDWAYEKLPILGGGGGGMLGGLF